MAILRSLRLAGTVLLALTILCILVLPSDFLPMGILVALAALTALDLLAVFLLTLVRDHSLRGFVQALVTLSLLLVLAGGVGSQLTTNSYYVELGVGESASLIGPGLEGYTLTFEPGAPDRENAEMLNVALTQPDQVSIHETVMPSEPMHYDGIEIHPMKSDGEQAVFLVSRDWFRPLIWLGGILFVIGLGLSALPPVRKRGEG